jgi:hypothetical protein
MGFIINYNEVIINIIIKSDKLPFENLWYNKLAALASYIRARLTI